MPVKIWANRGASFYMPENTMEAFKLAKKQKADGIKIDVQLTKDGRVVVLHEEKLDNVSDGKGLVKDYKFEDLKKLNFNKKYPDIDNVVLASLDEVLKFVKGTDLTVDIEFRTLWYQYKGIVKKVLELVDKFGLKEQVVYSSFNHETLAKLRTYDKKAKISPSISDGYINVVKYASRLEADFINAAYYLLQNEDLVKKAKRRDIPLNVWSVDEEEEMSWLMKQRVNAVITGKPDVAFSLREKNKGDKK